NPLQTSTLMPMMFPNQDQEDLTTLSDFLTTLSKNMTSHSPSLSSIQSASNPAPPSFVPSSASVGVGDAVVGPYDVLMGVVGRVAGGVKVREGDVEILTTGWQQHARGEEDGGIEEVMEGLEGLRVCGDGERVKRHLWVVETLRRVVGERLKGSGAQMGKEVVKS
ncbi:hypothetical protein HDU67_004289, partial [Dinochytrium kinnereticum]